jgi:hypothetical protein
MIGSVRGIESERARAMKQGKKTAIAKTMRVATSFTGAAAFAAAFAPGATAAAQPAANLPYRPFPLAERHDGRGNLANAANIRSGPCSVHPTWLHVRYVSLLGGGPFETCYGFTGTLPVNFIMISQCGGNNSGHFSPGNLTFHQGRTDRVFTPNSPYVSKITIKGWKGSDTCPL